MKMAADVFASALIGRAEALLTTNHCVIDTLNLFVH